MVLEGTKIRRVAGKIKRRIFHTPSVPKAEPGVIDLYPKYITKTDVVIEVGAHAGGSTALLSALALKVYTFEPDKRFFRSIRKVSRACKNVEAWNLACGSAKGVAFLNQMNDESSDVSSIPKIRGFSYTRKQKANVVALDDLSFGLKPTAIILDCEGSELEVLKGSKKILNSAKTVLVETHYLSDGHQTLDDCRQEIELTDRFDIVTTVDDDGMPWLICATRGREI